MSKSEKIILKNIDELCKHYGISRSKLSKSTYHSESAIQKCFDREAITLSMAEDIAEYFKVPLKDLLDEKTISMKKPSEKYNFEFFGLCQHYSMENITPQCPECGTEDVYMEINEKCDYKLENIVGIFAGMCLEVTPNYMILCKPLNKTWTMYYGAYDKEPIIETCTLKEDIEDPDEAIKMTVKEMAPSLDKIILMIEDEPGEWKIM